MRQLPAVFSYIYHSQTYRNFLMFIYLFRERRRERERERKRERERERNLHMHGRGAEKERGKERESEVGSALSAQSSRLSLNLGTMISLPEPKSRVGC